MRASPRPRDFCHIGAKQAISTSDVATSAKKGIGCAFVNTFMIAGIGALAEGSDWLYFAGHQMVLSGLASEAAPTGVNQVGGLISIGGGLLTYGMAIGAQYLALDATVSMAQGGRGRGLGLNSAGLFYAATGCH